MQKYIVILSSREWAMGRETVGRAQSTRGTLDHPRILANTYVCSLHTAGCSHIPSAHLPQRHQENPHHRPWLSLEREGLVTVEAAAPQGGTQEQVR